ncbi:MAG: hypothetical protein HC919_05005 [Oscillatoriales cyanobacterium SM2_2_1]|nr:hypothetical protein [Oscillatoriales cyanobacterium SM2_2_1]
MGIWKWLGVGMLTVVTLWDGSGRTLAQMPSCPRAEEVDSFQTQNFRVFICKGQDNRLFYRGVDKQTRASINLPVQIGDTAYVATNGNVVYRVNNRVLEVYDGRRLLLREAVIGR